MQGTGVLSCFSYRMVSSVFFLGRFAVFLLFALWAILVETLSKPNRDLRLCMLIIILLLLPIYRRQNVNLPLSDNTPYPMHNNAPYFVHCYLRRRKPMPKRCTAARSSSSRTDGSAMLINALARSAKGRLRR